MDASNSPQQDAGAVKNQIAVILADTAKSPEEKADDIITLMVAGAALAAIIPAHVNWAFFAACLGAGVVGIGHAYGVKLDDAGAWKLIRQFFFAAGFTFVALAVGSKFLAAILTSTGVGYLIAAPMDAAISSAIAYAVGMCAKAYFQGERDRDVLRAQFRAAFNAKRGK